MKKFNINDIIDIIDTAARAYVPTYYLLKVMRVGSAQTYSNEYGEGTYSLEPGDPKLEGTRGEHWSPSWNKIIQKYLLLNGHQIVPEDLPMDIWVVIQTNPDPSIREKSMVGAIDPRLISDEPFEVDGLIIDPAVDMLCMGIEDGRPTIKWGMWPVKKDIFTDTYYRKV